MTFAVGLLACVAPVQEQEAVLERLQAAFRALGPFRAEFAVQGFTMGEGRPVRRMEVSTDVKGRRIYATLHGKEPDGSGWKVHQYVGQGLATTWGEGVQLLVQDHSPALGYMQRVYETWKDVGRLIGKRITVRPLEPQLTLHLSAEGADVKLGVAFGLGTAPGSWFEELEKRTVLDRLEATEAAFSIAAARKTIVLDRTTGLPKRFAAEGANGRKAVLSLLAFVPDAPFPAVEVPGSDVLRRPAKEEVDLVLRGVFHSTLPGVLQLLAIHWDRISEDPARKGVRELFTRWGALRAQARYEFLLHVWVRAWLRRYREGASGRPREDAGLELEAFRRFLADHERDLAEARASSVGGFRDDLIEAAGRRVTDAAPATREEMRKLLRESLRMEAVDPERRRLDEGLLQRVFLAEIERLPRE